MSEKSFENCTHADFVCINTEKGNFQKLCSSTLKSLSSGDGDRVSKPAEKTEEIAKPLVAPAKEAQPAPVKEQKAEIRPTKIAVLNVYSSKNDTIITATDVTGAETLAWASGGMMVKADREEGRPYAAAQATLKVGNQLKEKGFGRVHIKIRGPGGNRSKTPASGAQAVVRTVARMGIKIIKIEDVTPLPTDSMKGKGGRRGRRV